MNILDNLSEEQRKPAMVKEGPVLVTAGAGSGKTRMLTHRIAHLVETGVSPRNILAITFTNKAANEMKERLSRMIENVDDMWVSTFHSFCMKILRMNIHLMGYTSSFSIYDEEDKKNIIKKVNEKYGFNESEKEIAKILSNLKNKYINNDYNGQNYFGLFKDFLDDYNKELKKCNALDFDDLLTKTYELFKSHPDILEYYQDRFKYIHVDEFQDTNHIQYALVQLLGEKHRNIFVVGDEDQCIYSWRGAEAYNIIQFSKDFKDTKVFKLEQNYRSTKNILLKANNLIENNRDRFEKVLWTNNNTGVNVEFKTKYDNEEESDFVVSTIKYLVQNCGYKYSDCAILMRVASLSRVYEDKFLTYNVPYNAYGLVKFYERKEIKDVISYLRLFVNKNDNESTKRMLTFPKKGIGDVKISELEVTAESEGVSLFECAMNSINLSTSLNKALLPVREMFRELQQKKDNLGLYDFANEVIKTAGIKDAIGDKNEEDRQKKCNIDELLSYIKKFEDDNIDVSLENFLQSVSLFRDTDNMSEDDGAVSVLTVHAAKGLEFKVVFVVGLNNGIFPLSRVVNENEDKGLEEERRLMYVAITRAKERLFLTRAMRQFSVENGCYQTAKPSQFLKECNGGVDVEQNKSRYYISNDSVMDRGVSSVEHRLSTRINIVNVNSEPISAPKSAKPAATNSQNAPFSAYKTGTKVRHEHFGEGVVTLGVTDFIGGFVTVKFDTVGIKTLSLKFAKLEIIE